VICPFPTVNAHWYKITNEAEIASPALLIFRERVEENIRRMVAIAGRPERLRPHIKTHKLGPLVRTQLAQGITKCKCATIAEAEMAAEAGATDVLLAFPAIGPTVNRLMQLQESFPNVTFSTIADSEESISALGTASRGRGRPLAVLLDVDCGMNRTGIVPGEQAARLYNLIFQMDGLRAGGLHVYDGHIVESDFEARAALCERAWVDVLEFRGRLQRAGMPVPRIVAGGTPTFPVHARHAERELSPGTCVLWDFGYGDKFSDLPFEPAAVLLTRVVSKPAKNRLCLDLGHKAVAAENPQPRVRLLELPEALPVMHSEEHLVVETPHAEKMHIGQCLHGVPRHVCPTVALHNEAWLIENRSARECWPITARARRLRI